jgi:hypothetical protein
MHRGQGNPASFLAHSVLEEKSNQIELFDVLFAHDFHVSDQLFNMAASRLDEDTMRYLVTKCQPEYMDASGALLVAAGRSNGRVVSILVDAGMDVNYHQMLAPSFDTHMFPSSTALHCAAEKGNAEVVKVLLEKGADKTVRNSWRQTAEDLARKEGHEEVAEIIRGWEGGGTFYCQNSAPLVLAPSFLTYPTISVYLYNLRPRRGWRSFALRLKNLRYCRSFYSFASTRR